MLFDVLVFGGAIFWTIIGLATLSILLFSGEESSFTAGAWITILAATVIVALTPIPPIDWGRIVTGLLAYLVVGAVWATTRWYLLLQKVKKLIHNLGDQSRKKVMDALRTQVHPRIWDYPPEPSRLSDDIWFWFVFWPFDVVGKVVTKPLSRIYYALTNSFSLMTDKVLGDVKLPPET